MMDGSGTTYRECRIIGRSLFIFCFLGSIAPFGVLDIWNAFRIDLNFGARGTEEYFRVCFLGSSICDEARAVDLWTAPFLVRGF